MNRFLQLFIFIGFALTITSCFKEDEMVQPYDRGDVVVKTIAMTQYYTNQVYFDLEEGEEVSVNNKNEWDLGFEGSGEGWHIILNTSAFMYAANTGITDFEQGIDTTGLQWKFDKSDGDLDSTAIGTWFALSIILTPLTPITFS